jgi:nucleotide-binding universal stress UspA family protein
MFQTILVPLDGSELAEAALEPALRLAQCFGGQVILLRVAAPEETPASLGTRGLSAVRPAVRGAPQDLALAESYLNRMRANKARAGVLLEIEVATGAPPQVIVAVADARQVDLIVMSTHGRAGLNRLIYGSVAEAVLRGAHRPVLIMPNHFNPSSN